MESHICISKLVIVFSNDAVSLLDINNSVPQYIYDEDIKGKYDYKLTDTFMGFHFGNTPACKMCDSRAVKYQLIQHRLLACRSISTMESQKCISKLIIVFSFNIFIIDILWNRVVDIKQCNCIIGNAKSDVLAECSVDINLTGYRNSSGNQTAIYIARFKSKL